MTLPSSGAISLSQIAGEFGGKNPLELGEYRGQDNAPTTGAISFFNFYGTDGIPTSGLQYHYDGQISEHNDPSAGNVQDLGSSNYTGTLTNGAAYNTGDFGKVVLDGVDDYVNLSGYNGVTGTGARTSIVFFKLDASPPSAVQRLLTWGDPTAGTGKKWAMEINTSGQFNLGVGGAYRLATKTLTTNTWNMIAATFSGGSGAGTPSAIFNFLYVGTRVSGTGVPANTTVTAFNSSTGAITLSNNLTTTLSNTTLTFTNDYLIATGGSGGGGGGASGGSGGSSSGLERTAGGSGGNGGNSGSNSSYGGGGGGAAGYSGNGGNGNNGTSASGSSGSGGGGGGGGSTNGGGGVGIYGAGSSGSGSGGGSGGGSGNSSSSIDGGDGGAYGGGGGGVRGSASSSYIGGFGGYGVARFVWGSNSYPSNAANGISTQQTFTSSGTFTVPSGVTSISALVVGGGGGGGDNDPDKHDEPGAGGGGGGLAYGSWTVSAGQQYTVTVGTRGNRGNGDGSPGGSGGTTSIYRSETESVSGTTGTNTITAGSGAANDIPNITLYHNAQKLINYSDVAGAIDTSTGTNVAIGRANAGAAGNVDGEVAKALIYNRELTHAEIGQIYNAKCVALGLSQESISTETGGGSYFSPYPYGYFGGGAVVSRVERIDYSNDTATASPKGPLSSARGYLAATGNSSFGYFGGGTPGSLSTVDRIDYSNDTATASPKGPLSSTRYRLAATGNSYFGYFGGGQPGPRSTVDRIDYSNDTVTASPKGPLSVQRHLLAATGNSSFGYFGGGFPGPASRVDRIDYTSDTVTASPKGPLSTQRYALAATGNSSFGYFGGGYSPYFSRVDRIDYSNDTATASVKGPLSLARSGLAATGNSSFGYFGGGVYSSTVDRIDYSNDTATASVRGPLSYISYLSAASAEANGYSGPTPPPSPAPAPTYSITQTAIEIWETTNGPTQSTTFTITTANVANGTTLYWTCGGGNVFHLQTLLKIQLPDLSLLTTILVL